MALGLAAAGVILSFVYQEFNYDSEHVNSETIFRIIQKDGDQQSPYTFAPLAEELKANFPEIENTVRVSFFYGYLACSTSENKFNETGAIFADPDFFNLFSFPLISGNSKDCLLSPNSVVISQKASKKYFGNEDPVGKSFKVGEHKEIIVSGVFEDFKSNSNFQGDLVFPLEKISKLTQIWIEPSWKHESEIHTFVLFSDNTNPEEISKKCENYISNYIENSKHELSFQPLQNIHVENQFFWESTQQANVSYLFIFIAVAAIIISISVANFLFLYIGTTSQRTVDIGIKKVCGASKSTLFFDYLKEVFALFFISTIIAITLFILYNSLFVKSFSFLPQIILFDYKLGILLFSILTIIALLAGIYPSMFLSSHKPVSLFSSSKNIGMGRLKLVNVLVIAQFALCITLITGTFVMHKQTRFLVKQDMGFAKEELITIPLNMHVGHGIYNERFSVFAEELKKNSGIKNVTLGFSSPSSSGIGESFPDWEGKTEDTKVEMFWCPVSFNYFETLGLEIVEGRAFSEEFPGDEVNWDKRTSNYIINEKAVSEMGIADAIGKAFEIYGFKGQIVGVVEDYNFKSLHTEIAPMFYQVSPFYLNEIIVRGDLKNPAILSDIENVWDKFVPEYPLDFGFVSDQISKLYEPEQNLASTLNIFSLIAIAIACMGLFTLTILSINHRIKEIGIRKVNGAKVSEILSMLNKDFIKWVVIAFVVACPIAWYAMDRWLEGFAYKTTLSWWIFALAGVLALGIALLTVSWQSWRAATRNPVEALRHE
ncbi:MAG: FtsX-like permease family protein [Prolixibacteraceae bacterium]|jgi:putative ABC transport system permease protein|nr:FtsX-like permease family protein [Prolixibacteraceae bacterium]MBT6997984.1 FtsX-like permease family protein [Prolixibacteraceae bacterium]MBT7396006.1 FtsX-like permease family protein [Prolixibacteraceae bacterium]